MDPFYCDCPACTSPVEISAIDLMAAADLDELLELAENPRHLFRGPEETFGLYLAPWYKSTGPTPCLFKCLMGALNQIIFIRIARFERRDREENEAWLARIRDEVAPELPASLYAEILARHDDKTIAGILDVALAFWIEAAQAYDNCHDKRAWPALTQSQLYIGLATGPEYASEQSARGGKQRGSNYDPTTQEALRVLQALPSNYFPHISQAKAHVAEELENFGAANPKYRSTNPLAFLDSCFRKSKPKSLRLATELARVSVKLKGRPPKPSTPPNKKKADSIESAPPSD